MIKPNTKSMYSSTWEPFWYVLEPFQTLTGQREQSKFSVSLLLLLQVKAIEDTSVVKNAFCIALEGTKKLYRFGTRWGIPVLETTITLAMLSIAQVSWGEKQMDRSEKKGKSIHIFWWFSSNIEIEDR